MKLIGVRISFPGSPEPLYIIEKGCPDSPVCRELDDRANGRPSWGHFTKGKGIWRKGKQVCTDDQIVYHEDVEIAPITDRMAFLIGLLDPGWNTMGEES